MARVKQAGVRKQHRSLPSNKPIIISPMPSKSDREKPPRELLEILACPVCKGSLEYDEEENKLICHKCRLKFPIREGIPIMLEEEAEKF